MSSTPPLRVVIAPDSFKGSITAAQAAAAIAAGLRRVWVDADLRLVPLADGGEGTLDAVLSAGGKRSSARVSGADHAPIDAAYGLVAADTAVIEIAQIVGLTREAVTAHGVEQRSTKGVGELMRRLLDAGIRRMMVGLGGSSTNDGGAGLLVGLGLKLVAADGCTVEPTPAGLAVAHGSRHQRSRFAPGANPYYDHVGRQQCALRRARRDGNLRAAEGRASQTR